MVTGDCAEHSYYYWLLDVQSSTIINGHWSMCRVLLLLLLVTGTVPADCAEHYYYDWGLDCAEHSY